MRQRLKRSGLHVSSAGVPRDEKGTISWLKRESAEVAAAMVSATVPTTAAGLYPDVGDELAGRAGDGDGPFLIALAPLNFVGAGGGGTMASRAAH